MDRMTPLDMRGIAEYLGVNYVNVRLWNANRLRKERGETEPRTTSAVTLPEPDGDLHGRPWWRRGSIEDWNARERVAS